MIFAKPIALIALLFLALLWWAWPSHAQQGFKIPIELPCNTTEFIIKMLLEEHREVPTGGGPSKGEQIRLFESHDAGDKQTWTLVISNPNGLSCIIRGGQDWITDPAIIKGDPS